MIINIGLYNTKYKQVAKSSCVCHSAPSAGFSLLAMSDVLLLSQFADALLR